MASRPLQHLLDIEPFELRSVVDLDVFGLDPPLLTHRQISEVVDGHCLESVNEAHTLGLDEPVDLYDS